ncbi:hypothetical protein VNO80_06507 [Phaseolus coccineus]|uniref:Uncharacterized protein n=1 Tax=Phaseolus coccineus TaxID=3886 RepID=A0AAN9NGZ3_PHACN
MQMCDDSSRDMHRKTVVYRCFPSQVLNWELATFKPMPAPHAVQGSLLLLHNYPFSKRGDGSASIKRVIQFWSWKMGVAGAEAENSFDACQFEPSVVGLFSAEEVCVLAVGCKAI